MMTTNNNHVDEYSYTRGAGNYIKKWFVQDTMEVESDFRNNMLVVATLIVAVTFQTVISPPGGTWDETKTGPKGEEIQLAGTAILATFHVPFHLILVLNTLAFSMSTQLMLVLLYHKKLYFEVVVATLAMVATYLTVIWTLCPEKDVKFRYVCMAALFPYLWRLFYQTFRSCISRCCSCAACK